MVHTFGDLRTRSFPRDGAAFIASDVNDIEGSHDVTLDGAAGGYPADGRVDPRAQIVYVTHENMDSTLPADFFGNREGSANQKTPVVARFLGAVGAFDSVQATPEAAGAQVPPGAFNNNRKLSHGRDCREREADAVRGRTPCGISG